jgi:hypothetical protein
MTKRVLKLVLMTSFFFSVPSVVNPTSIPMANVLRRRLFLAMALVVGASGCGGREAYQVTGQAKYQDGSPITGGVRVIRLEPTVDSQAVIRKAASGNIAEDGSFELFTRRPGDGVLPGSYAVTFTVLDKPMGGRSLIPDKYTYKADTPFELEVDEDKDDLIFELEKL